mmetsp:Transcript_4104/g.14694  ORF Transcript_4104/g.14694 Transcript_4104/m.14694 type:complete len:550 (-) Transcript_4104:281-1930(-)
MEPSSNGGDDDDMADRRWDGDVSGGPQVIDWNFFQVFGERENAAEEVQDADIISAIEFSRDGRHLATGDRGGRVVLFAQGDATYGRQKSRDDGAEDMQVDGAAPARSDVAVPRSKQLYRYVTEFQSHEPEFDYLKSLDIEEKINKIRWVYSSNGAQFLLSTNDKTVKLWKVFERKVRCVVEQPHDANGGTQPISTTSTSTIDSSPAGNGLPPSAGGKGVLTLPRLVCTDRKLATRCRRVYSNAHTYNIHSISVNSDYETYLSSDDLRINLWNLASESSFNIVDIKPANMEELTEVITRAEFHPHHCNLFAYGSSKGAIRLVDMRAKALCDQHHMLFEQSDTGTPRSFFSEVISSISDVKFSSDGRYLVSRDYMTVKLWDVNCEREPVVTLDVHEHIRPCLTDLYENDAIFDKFECVLSGDGKHMATGSYSHMFRVFNHEHGTEATLEASKQPTRWRTPAEPLSLPGPKLRFGRRGSAVARIQDGTDSPRKGGGAEGANGGASLGSDFPERLDYGSKLLHLAWSPSANVMAVAAANALYMFTGDSVETPP